MQKSVPKVPKVLTFGNVSQKIQNSWKLSYGSDNIYSSATLVRIVTAGTEVTLVMVVKVVRQTCPNRFLRDLRNPTLFNIFLPNLAVFPPSLYLYMCTNII